MEKLPRTSQEQRRDRVESAARFFKRLIPEERFADGQYFMDLMQKPEADPDDFIGLVRSFYGIVHGIPNAEQRAKKTVDINTHIVNNIVSPQYPVLVFPNAESKRTLTHEVFHTMQGIAQQERTPETQHVFARVLAMYFHYVHPLADGNTRASRMAYGLMDPGIDRDMTSPQFIDALANTPERQTGVLQLITREISGRLFAKRGIKTNPESIHLSRVINYQFPSQPEEKMVSPHFETNVIGFLVLHDAMSPEDFESRVQYGTDGVPFLRLGDCSPRQQQLFDQVHYRVTERGRSRHSDKAYPADEHSNYQKIEAVRVEFAREVLEAAADPHDPFDVRYQELLKNHFLQSTSSI